jgi:hypothetical protein
MAITTDRRALLHLDISNTNIGEINWESVNKMDGTGNFHWKHTDGRTQEHTPAEGEVKPEGIIATANAISDMGALTSLDISKNGLGAEGTKQLAKALENNQIMTALSISSNGMTWDGEKHGDVSGVAALADVIPGMGALSKLDINNNNIPTEQMEELKTQCALKGVVLEDASDEGCAQS